MELVGVVAVVGLSVLGPWAVLLGPPVVMTIRETWSWRWAAPWVAGVVSVIVWVISSVREMEAVDAAAGTGSIVSTIGWLLAALALAAASSRCAWRAPGRLGHP